MTTTQIVLIAILVIFILVGIYLFFQGLKSDDNQSDLDEIEYDKNGIPIIPRHQRKLIDDPVLDDTVAGETEIAPDRSQFQTVIEDEPIQTDYVDGSYLNSDNSELKDSYEVDDNLAAKYSPGEDDGRIDTFSARATNRDDIDWQEAGRHEDDPEYAEIGRRIDAVNNEPDLFSSLASATENLTSPVSVAQEPEFTENSPVLDQHLLAEANNDQNSPLNNAEQNINITLIPKNKFEVIKGETVLALIEQYGLKYGAMNMFHRYENKEGSGILWFSMMGMDVDGITSFDLNTLTSDEFTGLILFLSLPHPKALQGFDSMMSIAGLMAKQLDTLILDEDNEPMTREHKLQLRQQVQDYQQQW